MGLKLEDKSSVLYHKMYNGKIVHLPIAPPPHFNKYREF